MTDFLPILFCVDIEPDPREVDWGSTESWTGFEKLAIAAPSIRETLEAATRRSAHFTWSLRMDPQIAEVWGDPGWAAQTYQRELALLTDAGDELGVHPHNWRWHATARRWFSERADEGWVAHCAQMALDSYRAAFGHPSASYRHGDRSMTTHLARVIDDAGVQVDVTVEPGRSRVGAFPGELATGWIENTITAPTRPYRPSRDDFRIPDPGRRDGLLMIPLTRGLGLDVAGDPDRARPRGWWRTLTLVERPELFRDGLVRRLNDPTLTHLAFAIRSDLPLRSKWAWLEANLAELCRHPRASEFRFCTASEAAHVLAPIADRRRGRRVPDVTASSRADLWARGSEDPGYVDDAEADGMRVLGDFATRTLDQVSELGATTKALTERVHTAEAALTDARREVEAIRDTTTWRAHNRALPFLRAVRRVIPRRR
jgi:hypothetical protein